MKVPSAHSPLELPGVRKPVSFKMSSTELEHVEMRSCLKKLRQLVPTLPRQGPVAEVELIQHVIDYIHSLEDQLDTHPIHRFLLTQCSAPPAFMDAKQSACTASPAFIDAKQSGCTASPPCLEDNLERLQIGAPTATTSSVSTSASSWREGDGPCLSDPATVQMTSQVLERRPLADMRQIEHTYQMSVSPSDLSPRGSL